MEEVENVPVKQQIKVVLRILKQAWILNRKSFIYFFTGALLEIGSFIVSIYATAQLGGLLASFITTNQTDGIWFWLAIDIGSVVVMSLAFLLMSYAKQLAYFSFARWSMASFLQSLNSVDIDYFYNKKGRNHINKVASGYTWQVSNLAQSAFDLIYGLLRFGAITLVVAQISWWLIPIIALFLVPTLLAEKRMATMLWFVWDKKGDTRYIFWGIEWIFRQAKGQMELRSTQASKFFLNRIDGMNKDFYDEQQAHFKKSYRTMVPTKILEVVGTAVGSVILIRQLLSRSIGLDRYFFLSGALLRIGGALNAIFGTLSRMQEPVLFAHSYFELIDVQPTITDPDEAVDIASKTVPTIEFKNVSFSYPGSKQAIFKNFNLTIKPGEHIALVGENGAGKTTLIKLLLRFYTPTSGQILINGQDIQDISIQSWYEQIATLFQDFNHYPLPIDENIAVGRSSEKVQDKLVKAAGKKGGVDGIVKSYPKGWKTYLDSSFQDGVEPSGGQWQRVALSRAFYRDAHVLILDEPTSAIDARAEYDIFNNIFEAYKHKSVLIVSHRFSTVRRADRIIVLEHGAIIEEGSHASLMKQNGTYHDLFSKQAEGYRE